MGNFHVVSLCIYPHLPAGGGLVEINADSSDIFITTWLFENVGLVFTATHAVT